MSEPTPEDFGGEFVFDDSYDQSDFTAEAVRNEYADESVLEEGRKQRATEEGVQDARFAGYAEVLRVYEARSDTEPLRDRRARALATDPAQQDFTRAAGYTGQATEAESSYPAEAAAGEDDQTDP